MVGNKLLRLYSIYESEAEGQQQKGILFSIFCKF